MDGEWEPPMIDNPEYKVIEGVDKKYSCTVIYFKGVGVLVLQSLGRWFDSPLLHSFGWAFKPRCRLHYLVSSGG